MANSRATSCTDAEKFISSSHSSHRHVSHRLGWIPDPNFSSEGPWNSVVLQTGALPTLWTKQVEKDSLGTRPPGVIIADCEIQLERGVCLIHNFRVFVPTHAARRKPLRLHGCNILGTSHLASQHACSYGYHIAKDASSPHRAVSRTAFRRATQAASEQGSWSSLTIYCLRQSLLLHHRRSRPQKSRQAALAQAASWRNSSSGCIYTA